ncbi:diacylglycerol/lipid kinase family protein [Paenibacillus thermotolerans]|uniref:diacylglycerol/lipid kinase family protein n=1 Tax=Paenibacillus thermotolerans TaxID=3027807 RepID=UPI002367DB61|nr:MULTISPECIES: diacylglycerol kinase family protein [unclassified Paenibacillus]
MIGFVVNARAGRGNGLKVWRTVERLLRERNVPYTAKFTEYRGHAVSLASEMARGDGVLSVTAIGGDGTVNETVQGLYGTGVPFGCIPAGSGNDYIRGLNLPRDPESALHRIVNRQLKRIDLGKAAGRYFVNTFGAGFDGEVARANNDSAYKGWMNKLGLGSLSYAITVVSTLASYQPKRITIEIDGAKQAFADVWMVVAANIPYYGGGMMICPDAVNDDGRFEVCVVHGLTRLQLLRFFPLIYKGAHVTLPYVTFLKGRQLSIESEQPIVSHVDGETLQTNPVKIDMAEDGLTVIA